LDDDDDSELDDAFRFLDVAVEGSNFGVLPLPLLVDMALSSLVCGVFSLPID